MGTGLPGAIGSQDRVGSGPFSFSHSELELRRDGKPIDLQRQPALVLSYLLRHPGRVLTHDEIAKQVWGDGRHVAVDQSLRYCVRQIRRALQDDADRPIYVETLPRKGYRWVAPLRRAHRAEERSLASMLRVGRSPMAAVAVVALCVGLVVGRNLPQTVPVAIRNTPSPSIAQDMRVAFDALHVLAHAAIEPGYEDRAADAAWTLWAVASSWIGLEPATN
jgi:DNA-binding winged helix-turn-helix (wHTH) protein